MKLSLGKAALVSAALLVAEETSGQVEAPIGHRAPRQVPVARALPVETPTPIPEPTIMRALPVPAETERAVPEAAASSPESSSSESTESSEQRQLDYANALFGRKLYDLAVPEYEKFLGLYPDSPDRASALFYMGEAYRALGRTAAARTSFQSVLTDHPDSEFAGPASYGVAEIFFNQKDYSSALPLFHRSAAKTKTAALALSARYFEGRCLENLDRKDEARDVYEQVIAAKNPNPFRDDARSAVASIFLAKGRKADAFEQFEALAGETDKAALRAEATVRAGLLALDLAQSEKGKTDKAMTAKATALLQKGRGLPDAGRWRGVAAVGLLRLEYQTGQYAQAIADYQRSKDQVPEEMRPEMMLLAANSHRQLEHFKEAQELYRQIMQKYPERDEAKDARYQHLIGLYNANDPALREEIDQFINDSAAGERADQARLLKAEALYKERDFAGAATLYDVLRDSKLSTKLRAESAFKLGWCFVQTQEPLKAIDAFAYFLQAFPENAQVPSALAQRALAYQETKQYERALADLESLLTKFPQAREREAALQQKALLLGQTDNNNGMMLAFQQLLKEFPKSKAAAQAHYYIGKAAFEAKNYETALGELRIARQLNREQYGTPATLRIMSSQFYLKHRDALAQETNDFFQTSPNGQVPAEILEWLGIEFYNTKDYAAAAKYLAALSKSSNLASIKPDFWFYLGDAQMKLDRPADAEVSLEKFVASASDPAAKAKALLSLGAAKIAAHKPEEAKKIADEIMALQPEGRVNAQARLLAGDVEVERNHFDEAGKAFQSVALLYDDPAITPQALDKAAKAYEKAGKLDEAKRVAEQLREKYPGYAGG